MKQRLYLAFILVFWGIQSIYSQTNIGDFTSITPSTPTDQFIIPSSHSFQKIVESGDNLTEGGVFKILPDFTAYVPISNSSTNGYLSINSEGTSQFDPNGGGGVMVFDINFNGTTKLWETTASEDLDFSSVGSTAANCSGTVTSWGTVVTCEEFLLSDFFPPFNGYNDVGWNIEIDPATKTIVNNQKLWAMGSFKHENVTIHSNDRTVYQGVDDSTGYLYKYVMDVAQNLHSGKLYVYVGSKNGSGGWVLLNNSTQLEQNTTLNQSANVGGTVFDGIEDVEVGPDGWVYFAVKGEGTVYRFTDSDPLEAVASTVTMETFVGGGASYNINDGASTIPVAWGNNNDNLAFDGQGNLWVLQDGGNGYIWVVKSGHTQASPDVEIFGRVPTGSEPTGITFTPDYKYLFMSIQHPNNSNIANQIDVAGNTLNFDKGTSLVIALNENIGSSLSADDLANNNVVKLSPNPLNPNTSELSINSNQIERIRLFSILGDLLIDKNINTTDKVKLSLKNFKSGLYLLQVNTDSKVTKLIIK